MKTLKFLITRHVYILLLVLLITAVQLIKCEQSPPQSSHNECNITLTAKDGTVYTYNAKPPKKLRLGKGSFGDAIIGERIENGISMQVAMKIEKIAKTHIPMLHNEQRMYKILNGQAGIPHFFDYFHNYNGKAVLVIELLGKSLDSLLKSKKTFSIKTSMMIGLRILDIIEAIHEKGLIYSDIKPNNLAIGREDKSKIYILDFGLSTFYITDGKHIKPNHGHGSGTAKYMSLYAHSHQNQSRRDDIESIAYLLIEFLNGRIWSTNTVKDIIHEKSTWGVKKIAGHKCSDTMLEFLKYARGLNFTENPDYDYLRRLLQNELTKNQLINDGHFDWMKSSTETDVVQSPTIVMSTVHEQSSEIPQMHSFTAKDSLIETANEMPPMNILVAANNHKSLNDPQKHQQLVVQQPQVQNVLLGQPMQPMMRVTHSIPIVSNVLPTSFAQIQHQPQQLQHLTPVLIQ